VSPVGGNPGTTLGAQRLHVVETAARMWGEILPSKVEIRVQASFDLLFCAPDRGVLGAASPIGVYTGFPGQPIDHTWYHGALANRLAGRDLAITQNDILAQFN